MFTNARILDRALLRLVYTDAAHEAQAADAGFDAGEFSSAVHQWAFDEGHQRVLLRVANALGLSIEELDEEHQRYLHATEQLIHDGTLPMSVLYG